MHDILTNLTDPKIDCLDKGHVRLIDCMPRLAPEGQTTADFAIVQAARVSYGAGTKTVNEDRGLIRYLMRHSHTTPLEMVEFKFHMKMPIFIARQIVRHRTSNLNEISARYSVMKDEFYVPELENIRKQSKTNKQGGEESLELSQAHGFAQDTLEISELTYEKYLKHIESGVTREQARMNLPVNLYTEWYWKCDLHNLLHFLALRCHSHAQWEVRVFADAMLELIKPIVPVTIEAWEDYHPMRGAVKLTRLELQALMECVENAKMPELYSDNKREREEWREKARKLGMNIED